VTGLLLFVSGYAPLFAIFGLRLDGTPSGVCFSVAVVLATAFFVVLALARIDAEPQQVQVSTVTPRDTDVAAYLATYLLPFVTVSQPTGRDIAGFLLYGLVLVIVARRGALVGVNPLAYLLGLRLVTVTTATGRSVLLLTRHLPRRDVTIIAQDVVGGGLVVRSREDDRAD